MIRIVLVEPQFEINIGSAARAMKNFGANELVLVKPKTKIGAEAYMFSKHAQNILKKAKTVGTIDEAVKGCRVVAGTTGVLNRYGRRIKNCITLKEFSERVSRKEKIAIIFGNEGTGLDDKMLRKCDFVISIPANKKYPVLNLSHAVAVVLYELQNAKIKSHYKTAERKSTQYLVKMFREIVNELGEINDREKIVRAFENVLGRSRIAENELQSLFAAFGGMRKRIVRKKAGGKNTLL